MWGPVRARLGLFLLGVLVLAGLLAFLRGLYTVAPDRTEQVDRFSVSRAFQDLEVLTRFGPRPTGSPGNRAARHWLIDRIKDLGLVAQATPVYPCGDPARCDPIENVLTRLPGSPGRSAVLLSAHYDSVAGSPGASDNGLGVVTLLEVARVLRAGRPPRNNVTLLFTDGEERGLLGAEAYPLQDELFPRTRAVVNLDARGTSGPVLMFETGPSNLEFIRVYSRSVRRPVTSSVFALAYRYMPNDTDFTVYLRHRLRGYNLSLIQGEEHYHRPSDDFDRVSESSLQHLGNTTLELVSSLAEEELPFKGRDNAVFFDVMTRSTVFWPSGWSPVLALGSVGLLALGVWLHRRALSLVRISRWAGRILMTTLLAAALGFGLSAVAGPSAGDSGNALSLPDLIEALCWLAGGLAPVALGLLVSKDRDPWCAWTSVWSIWGMSALILAVVLPEASYLVLVPSLVAALGGIVCGLVRSSVLWGILLFLPAGAAAILWFPLLLAIEAAFQWAAVPWIVGATVLVVSSALPLCSLSDGGPEQTGMVVP